MKTMIMMSLMILATNAFAISYEECVETVSEAVLVNEAGEVFSEKLNKALSTGNQKELDKASGVLAEVTKTVANFCEYTSAK